MIAVLQRVTSSAVVVEGETVGSIGTGFTILLGVLKEDSKEDIDKALRKILHLRVFADDAGKMNLSLKQVEGEMLIVSQFTLYGDCRKGRRPSFTGSAPPEEAEKLYEDFIEEVRGHGVLTRHGVFGAMMDVELVNDGPVTLIVDTP